MTASASTLAKPSAEQDVSSSKACDIAHIQAPPSKSHSIRALFIAALAPEGSISSLRRVLWAEDTRACLRFVEALGCKIEVLACGPQSADLRITAKSPNYLRDPEHSISLDLGNSGTSLYFATALAATLSCKFIFDGDESLRSRPNHELHAALRQLGARIEYIRRQGYCPFSVQGPIDSAALAGKPIQVAAKSSQYLSALLLASPLIASPRQAKQCPSTHIQLSLLNERPYVEMTLSWLEREGVRIHCRNDLMEFRIPCGQHFRGGAYQISGDYSAASFLFCASVFTARPLRISQLLELDQQADQKILQHLQKIGCQHRYIPAQPDSAINAEELLPALEFLPALEPSCALELNLNSMPDSLPVLAVLACALPGSSVFSGLAHARLKESDRISAMASFLQALGFTAQEEEDALRVEGLGIDACRRHLQATRKPIILESKDHRVLMAAALFQLLAPKLPLQILYPEQVAVSYPEFFTALKSFEASLSPKIPALGKDVP